MGNNLIVLIHYEFAPMRFGILSKTNAVLTPSPRVHCGEARHALECIV